MHTSSKIFLDPNLIQVNSAESATECLANCKSDHYGIALLSQLQSGLFECTCIKEHFYEKVIKYFS